MRITYRNANNKDYWAKRWGDIPADSPMENADAYPLKYAQMTVKDKSGKILEAGCGAGAFCATIATGVLTLSA